MVPVSAPDRSRPHATGGSALADAGPSRSLAPRHIVPRLPAYTPSRSGNSGTRGAAEGRGPLGRCEALRLRTIAAEKEAFHFPAQLGHRRMERFRPRIDDDGPLRTQPIERLAHGFAQPAFDAIARHGLAEGARNREPDAGPSGIRFPNAKGRETRSRKPAALFVNPSKILRSQEADTFRKTSDGLVPFGADRELLAPTRPAPRQHRTPILGLHASAEAVRLGAPAVVRLVRALRHSSCSIPSIKQAPGGSKSGGWETGESGERRHRR